MTFGPFLWKNVEKIENGRYNVSVYILGKVADALGYKLTFEPKEEDKSVFVRKPKNSGGLMKNLKKE